MSNSCVSTNGYLSILKPDGSTLGSGWLCKPDVFLDTLVLPAAGTYTVLINPHETRIGSATARLYTMVDVTGTISPGGPSVPVTISTPGQNARLTFTGSANQRVSLTLTGSTIGVSNSCVSTNGYLSILKPDGSTLGTGWLCKPDVFLDTLVLPAAGTYTVLINPHETRMGSATVRLYTMVDVTGTISPGGPSVPVTISTPGQNARLTFTGSANQRVSLTLTGSTIGVANSCVSSNGSLSILKPDGSTLGSTSLCKPTTTLATQTLPAAGTYTVFLNPHHINTGAATLTLTVVTTLAAASKPPAAQTPGAATTTAAPPSAGATDPAAASGAGRPAPPTRQPDPGVPGDRAAPTPAAPATAGVAEEAWLPDRLQLRGDPWLTRRPSTVCGATLAAEWAIGGHVGGWADPHPGRPAASSG